jgi:hypothetical protein
LPTKRVVTEEETSTALLRLVSPAAC